MENVRKEKQRFPDHNNQNKKKLFCGRTKLSHK